MWSIYIAVYLLGVYYFPTSEVISWRYDDSFFFYLLDGYFSQCVNVLQLIFTYLSIWSCWCRVFQCLHQILGRYYWFFCCWYERHSFFIWKNSTMSDIQSVLFWENMFYSIKSALLLVLNNRRPLHVVFMCPSYVTSRAFSCWCLVVPVGYNWNQPPPVDFCADIFGFIYASINKFSINLYWPKICLINAL